MIVLSFPCGLDLLVLILNSEILGHGGPISSGPGSPRRGSLVGLLVDDDDDYFWVAGWRIHDTAGIPFITASFHYRGYNRPLPEVHRVDPKPSLNTKVN